MSSFLNRVVGPSALGVRLFLWAGVLSPLPVSLTAIEALDEIEVIDSVDGSGFQITLRAIKRRHGEWDLMSEPGFLPNSRVVIGLLLGITKRVLIDGIVEHREIIPDERGEARLVVTGRDLTAVMSRKQKSRPFPAQSDSMIAWSVLAPYIAYGLVPTVTPTTGASLPTRYVAWQNETDFDFLERLANRNSYVFYIEPKTFLVNRAYFGPEDRPELPLPALRTAMDTQTNVESVSFTHSPLSAEFAQAPFFVPGTKLAMAMPPTPTLGLLPLTLFPDLPKRQRKLAESVKLDPLRASLLSQSAQKDVAQTVIASGTVNTLRYGDVLRSRRKVSMCGAGLSFDGYYRVAGVTHVITKGGYTQRFTLVREGTVSNTPVVFP